MRRRENVLGSFAKRLRDLRLARLGFLVILELFVTENRFKYRAWMYVEDCRGYLGEDVPRICGREGRINSGDRGDSFIGRRQKYRGRYDDQKDGC